MSENSQNTYGGQALIEGVMIRGKKTAVMSVRSPEGEIIRKEIKFSRFYKPQFLNVPITYFYEDYKNFSSADVQSNEEEDLNYSFLSKTFASLSKVQKEKILQVLRNAVSLEKTG